MNIFPQHTPTKTQWFHTDSADRFAVNCDQLPPTWMARAWPIVYDLNSTGHRMREWTEITWPTYMAVVGDSVSMGVGLQTQDTWSNMLAEQLSLDLVNISEAQTSIEHQLEQALRLIHRAPAVPRLLVMQWCDPRFRHYVYQGESVHLGITEPRTEGEHYWWINHQRSLAEQSDLEYRFRSAQQTIECLCQRANIALWQFTSSDQYQGWADDLAQPRRIHPDLDKSLTVHLEFLARDVELVKTTKEQRRKGWGERKPQAHPGLYHQQRILDSYWAAGIEIRY